MERYQFINSLAKKAGVNESEERLFAEIFLRKIYELIQPGDGIKLNGIGTAYYARTRFTMYSHTDKKDELSEVIILSDLVLNMNAESKPVIFTLPPAEEIKHNPLDKYFSLSPSKPVIQNSNSLEMDAINPPTGNELEVLLISKADKLLADHKVIKNFVDPGLIVDLSGSLGVETKNSFDDAFLDEELDSLFLTDINDEELLKELENISWALDDEPLNDSTENNFLSEVNDELKNNIAEPDQPITADIYSFNGSDETKPIVNETDKPGSTENLIDETVESSENFFNEIPDKKLSGDNYEFERVKSFSSEFREGNPGIENIVDEDAFQATIDRVTRELESNANSNENIIDGSDSLEKNENEFIEVIPKSSVYSPDKINVAAEEISSGDEDQSEGSKIDPEEYHRQALKEAASFVNDRRSLDISNEKKRSAILTMMIIVIILLLLASFYIYLKYIKAPESSFSSANGGGNNAKTSLVEMIERDFELPVTYPYPGSRRNEFFNFSGIDSSVFTANIVLNKNDLENTGIETSHKQNAISPVIVDPSSKPVVVRVKNNIYQYGETFVVQVGSFKSRTIAETEALKYSRLGRQTYIEEVEIPDRGIWYRLRIGNFLSVADADNFVNKTK